MSKVVDVIVDLKPMTISVEVNAESRELLLEKTKEALLSQIDEKFDTLNKTIVNPDALSMETVTPGLVVAVETEGNGEEYGIITAVNKKTVDVALKDGTILNGPASSFQKADVEDIDQFIWGRSLAARQAGTWYEGNTAYLNTNEGTLPIVFGKSRTTKFNVYVINGGGKYHTLTPDQLKFVTDHK